MRWGRLAAENHRGRTVPRVLGLALALGAAAWTAGYEVARDVGAAGWGGLVASLLVAAAGLVDDLAPVGPRGIRNHFRWMLSGRMTTGILKLVVVVGAAAGAVALQPRRATWVELVGVVLVAASANVANGLDVRPGRALKAFVVPAVAFWALGATALFPALLGLLATGVLVLPLDLRERAMLGDAGSNLLGFASGLGLYVVLSDLGVGMAALVAVGLNLLAETVTFSRAIETVAPLRWLDGLGRVRDSR